MAELNYDELKGILNEQMWAVAGKLPDGVEPILTTMERMIQRLEQRINNPGQQQLAKQLENELYR